MVNSAALSPATTSGPCGPSLCSPGCPRPPEPAPRLQPLCSPRKLPAAGWKGGPLSLSPRLGLAPGQEHVMQEVAAGCPWCSLEGMGWARPQVWSERWARLPLQKCCLKWVAAPLSAPVPAAWGDSTLVREHMERTDSPAVSGSRAHLGSAVVVGEPGSPCLPRGLSYRALRMRSSPGKGFARRTILMLRRQHPPAHHPRKDARWCPGLSPGLALLPGSRCFRFTRRVLPTCCLCAHNDGRAPAGSPAALAWLLRHTQHAHKGARGPRMRLDGDRQRACVVLASGWGERSEEGAVALGHVLTGGGAPRGQQLKLEVFCPNQG